MSVVETAEPRERGSVRVAVAPKASPTDTTAPRRDYLRVAPTPARRRRLARALVALLGLISILSLFVIVAANVVMAQQSYELGQVRTDQRAAVRRNAELRAEVAALSSPTRIVVEAETLGMIRAENFGFIESSVVAAEGTPTQPIDEVAKTLEESADKTRDADADTTP